MKTKNSEIIKKAKKLTMLAKEKGLIKSHTIAFKEFPVEEEVHEGKLKGYQ